VQHIHVHLNFFGAGLELQLDVGLQNGGDKNWYNLSVKSSIHSSRGITIVINVEPSTVNHSLYRPMISPPN
jgi:hypothetical protein